MPSEWQTAIEATQAASVRDTGANFNSGSLHYFQEWNGTNKRCPGYRFFIDSSVDPAQITGARFRFYMNQWGTTGLENNIRVPRKSYTTAFAGGNWSDDRYIFWAYNNSTSGSTTTVGPTTWPASGYIDWIDLDPDDIVAACNDAGHDHSTEGTYIAVLQLPGSGSNGPLVQLRGHTASAGSRPEFQIELTTGSWDLGAGTGTVTAGATVKGAPWEERTMGVWDCTGLTDQSDWTGNPGGWNTDYEITGNWTVTRTDNGTVGVLDIDSEAGTWAPDEQFLYINNDLSTQVYVDSVSFGSGLSNGSRGRFYWQWSGTSATLANDIFNAYDADNNLVFSILWQDHLFNNQVNSRRLSVHGNGTGATSDYAATTATSFDSQEIPPNRWHRIDWCEYLDGSGNRKLRLETVDLNGISYPTAEPTSTHHVLDVTLGSDRGGIDWFRMGQTQGAIGPAYSWQNLRVDAINRAEADPDNFLIGPWILTQDRLLDETVTGESTADGSPRVIRFIQGDDGLVTAGAYVPGAGSISKTGEADLASTVIAGSSVIPKLNLSYSLWGSGVATGAGSLGPYAFPVVEGVTEDLDVDYGSWVNTGSVRLDTDTATGGDSRRNFDVYLPDPNVFPKEDGLYPVAVWIHGGRWEDGDKGDILFGPGYPGPSNPLGGYYYNGSSRPMRDILTANGWVVISMNYRLSKIHGAESANRFQFPDHLDDIRLALSYIKANANTWNVDIRKLLMTGHSAGAYLSMLVSLLPTMPSYDGLSGNNYFQQWTDTEIGYDFRTSTRYDEVTMGYPVDDNIRPFAMAMWEPPVDLRWNSYLEQAQSGTYVLDDVIRKFLGAVRHTSDGTFPNYVWLSDTKTTHADIVDDSFSSNFITSEAPPLFHVSNDGNSFVMLDNFVPTFDNGANGGTASDGISDDGHGYFLRNAYSNAGVYYEEWFGPGLNHDNVNQYLGPSGTEFMDFVNHQLDLSLITESVGEASVSGDISVAQNVGREGKGTATGEGTALGGITFGAQTVTYYDSRTDGWFPAFGVLGPGNNETYGFGNYPQCAYLTTSLLTTQASSFGPYDTLKSTARRILEASGVSYARSGTTVTVTDAGHGLSTGDRRMFMNPSGSMDPRTEEITRISSDVYTFQHKDSGTDAGTLDVYRGEAGGAGTRIGEGGDGSGIVPATDIHVEARVRMTPTHGSWPAFWMRLNPGGAGQGEIDFFEPFNAEDGDDTWRFTIHALPPLGRTASLPAVDPGTELDWHIVSMDIERIDANTARITPYLDGQNVPEIFGTGGLNYRIANNGNGWMDAGWDWIHQVQIGGPYQGDPAFTTWNQQLWNGVAGDPDVTAWGLGDEPFAEVDYLLVRSLTVPEEAPTTVTWESNIEGADGNSVTNGIGNSFDGGWISAASTSVYDTDILPIGATKNAIIDTVVDSYAGHFYAPGTPLPVAYTRTYLYIPSPGGSGGSGFYPLLLHNGTDEMVLVQINNSERVFVRNSNFGASTDTGTTLSYDTWYRFDTWYDANAVGNNFTLRISEGNSITPLSTTSIDTTLALDVDKVTWGIEKTTGQSQTLHHAAHALDTADWIAPLSLPVVGIPGVVTDAGASVSGDLSSVPSTGYVWESTVNGAQDDPVTVGSYEFNDGYITGTATVDYVRSPIDTYGWVKHGIDGTNLYSEVGLDMPTPLSDLYGRFYFAVDGDPQGNYWLFSFRDSAGTFLGGLRYNSVTGESLDVYGGPDGFTNQGTLLNPPSYDTVYRVEWHYSDPTIEYRIYGYNSTTPIVAQPHTSPGGDIDKFRIGPSTHTANVAHTVWTAEHAVSDATWLGPSVPPEAFVDSTAAGEGSVSGDAVLNKFVDATVSGEAEVFGSISHDQIRFLDADITGEAEVSGDIASDQARLLSGTATGASAVSGDIDSTQLREVAGTIESGAAVYGDPSLIYYLTPSRSTGAGLIVSTLSTQAPTEKVITNGRSTGAGSVISMITLAHEVGEEVTGEAEVLGEPVRTKYTDSDPASGEAEVYGDFKVVKFLDRTVEGVASADGNISSEGTSEALMPVAQVRGRGTVVVPSLNLSKKVNVTATGVGFVEGEILSTGGFLLDGTATGGVTIVSPSISLNKYMQPAPFIARGRGTAYGSLTTNFEWDLGATPSGEGSVVGIPDIPRYLSGPVVGSATVVSSLTATSLNFWIVVDGVPQPAQVAGYVHDGTLKVGANGLKYLMTIGHDGP